nr:LURP-one-related family protein [Candidatus Sigynarchaeota archaeon]
MSLGSFREYMIREKWVSLRDKNYVMNVNQEPIGYFIRKLVTIRTTYRLKNMQDITEMIIQQKLIAVRASFKFYKPAGMAEDNDEVREENYIGMLKKAIFSIGQKYWFESPNKEKLLEIKGNIWGLKFKISKGGTQVAEISKKFWTIRDVYGVRIDPAVSDEDSLLILASVIVLHIIREQQRNNRSFFT